MMKIGILTFHDGFNHGAFLQAYSLQETLKAQGHEVKIINYKGKSHYNSEYQKLLFFKPYFTKKAIKRRLANLQKVLKFKKIHKQFNLTKFSHEIEEICEQENFDLVVLGSDEIWNYKNKLTGLDLTFFGKDVSAQRKVSYAPSFGQIQFDEQIPEEVIKALHDLNKISVRDTNSQKLLTHNNIASEKVLDPTFLLDFPLNKKPIKNNYILIYLNDIEKKNIPAIRAFANETGRTLVAIGYEKYWCDKNYVAIDPYEWIDFFGHADYVITNTFHGTIFSLKYRKKVAILSPGLKSNKISSLLDDLSLNSIMTENSEELAKIFESDYQYDRIFNRLTELRKASQSYLLGCTA